MKLKLTHIEHDNKETIGLLTVHSEKGKLLMVASTLEHNIDGVTKIEDGLHALIKYYSPKHQMYLWKFNNKNEVGRFFEIHIGNYFRDSEGCVLIGNGFSNIDNDNEIDIINSKGTFKKFMKLTEGIDHLIIEVV